MINPYTHTRTNTYAKCCVKIVQIQRPNWATCNKMVDPFAQDTFEQMYYLFICAVTVCVCELNLVQTSLYYIYSVYTLFDSIKLLICVAILSSQFAHHQHKNAWLRRVSRWLNSEDTVLKLEQTKHFMCNELSETNSNSRHRYKKHLKTQLISFSLITDLSCLRWFLSFGWGWGNSLQLFANTNHIRNANDCTHS